MNKKFFTTSIFLIVCLIFIVFDVYANQNNERFRAIKDDNALMQLKYSQELKKIENDAEALIVMLVSEIALQKGNIQFALYGYTSLLEKTNDVAIAKRDEELALSVGAYSLADDILQKWQQIEPNPSFDQKFINWQRNVIFKNNFDKIIKDFPYIVKNANETEKKLSFVYISELAATDKDLSKIGYKTIHYYAKKYNDYTESAIADLIFSSNSNHTFQAQKALQRLTKKNPSLIPNLALYMSLISTYLPEVFDSYFKKLTDDEVMKLSDFWTTLYVESLLRNKEIDKAYSIVLKQLDKEPSFERYFQAGYISSFKNKDPIETQNYFEKSYALANKTQHDRIALFAAISLINLDNVDLASKWVNKIDGKKFPFDKNFLIALCAFNDKNWNLVNTILQNLSKSKITRGIYYSKSDIFKLSILTLVQSLPPQQALNKLNISIDNYKNKLNNLKQSENEVKHKETLIKELSSLVYQRALLFAHKFSNYVDAIKDLHYYLNLNPDDPIALNALGYTMLKIPNQIDKGLNLIKKSYKLNPKSESTNDSLGWAYYLKGQYSKSLPYLEYAYKNLPNVETSSHLAAVYYELGYIEKAVSLFKEAYKFDNQDKELADLLKKYNIKI